MMQAMIFAAGLGTRLKPVTNEIPKALVNIGGQTLLERTVNTLESAGFNNIVINVHHFASQIKDYLVEKQNFGLNIKVSDETQHLLNTGGGLKAAASLFNDEEPILIHNVDIVSNVNLKHLYHLPSTLNAEAILLVSKRKTKRYLLFNEDMNLCGWFNTETNEIKTPYPSLDIHKCTQLAFSGIHIFSPTLFSLMDSFPDEFGIIDFYLKVCNKVNIKGYIQDDLKLIDVGKFETLDQAEQFISTLDHK